MAWLRQHPVQPGQPGPQRDLWVRMAVLHLHAGPDGLHRQGHAHLHASFDGRHDGCSDYWLLLSAHRQD